MGQLVVILVISLIGKYLSSIISFPIPETIISAIILFLLLEFKVLKADFFKDIMDLSCKYLAFLFLPVGVGIMTEFSTLTMNDYLKVFFAMILSTFLIMILTGKITDIIISVQEKIKKDKKEENK